MQHRNYFFVYDFETGGFSGKKNPATQIAFIILDIEGKEVDRYTSYIKPYGQKEGLIYTQSALDFTKTTMDKLNSQGRDLKEVYQKIASIFKQYSNKYQPLVLVGHNSDSFDIEFMETIFTLNGDKLSNYTISKSSFDTMAFSRLKWGNVEVNDHKLINVAERAGVSLVDAHEAMNDTEATAEIFAFFIKCLRGGGVAEKSNKKELIQFQF